MPSDESISEPDPLFVSAPTPERDALLRDPSTLCLNCGNALPGAYCPSCGQKAQALRQPVHRFIRDAFVEFFGVDGRIWPTLGALLFKPGTLTREYIAGRRQTYLRPLRVYLVSTLLFFFLLSLIDPVGRIRDNLMQSSDMTDSVLVADHVVYNDSIVALGYGALNDEREDVAEAQAEVDSLAQQLALPMEDREALEDDLRDAREDLNDAQDELESDSLDLMDRLRRARVEQAILATMPSDSLILLDGVHGAANLIYPDSTEFFTGTADEWLIRNSALRGMSGAATDAQRRDNLVQFLRSVIGYVPTVLFLILPVFALLLKILYVRRNWYYSEHLIFGLHTHAFAFVVFSLVTLCVWAMTAMSDGPVRGGVGWVVTALLASIPVYFFIAQKRVYGQGWIKTALKAAVLAFTYNAVLIFGLIVVFVLAAFLG